MADDCDRHQTEKELRRAQEALRAADRILDACRELVTARQIAWCLARGWAPRPRAGRPPLLSKGVAVELYAEDAVAAQVEGDALDDPGITGYPWPDEWLDDPEARAVAARVEP